MMLQIQEKPPDGVCRRNLIVFFAQLRINHWHLLFVVSTS